MFRSTNVGKLITVLSTSVCVSCFSFYVHLENDMYLGVLTLV